MEHATDTDIFLQNLAANICKQFGRNCEVAVHEFQGDTLVIKHIVNGYVTGRHAGDISTNAFLDEFVEKDFIRNPIYHMTTKDGRDILASTTPIRTGDETTGFVCINYDVMELNGIARALDWTNDNSRAADAVDVNEILDYHLAACEKLIGKKAGEMDKADKFRAVEYLESKHVFMITKSSIKVCDFLNLTKYALYAFLDEIRDRG